MKYFFGFNELSGTENNIFSNQEGNIIFKKCKGTMCGLQMTQKIKKTCYSPPFTTKHQSKQWTLFAFTPLIEITYAQSFHNMNFRGKK